MSKKHPYLNVKLIKLNTLEDAEHPQREEYPNNSTKTGVIFSNKYLPKVGDGFIVFMVIKPFNKLMPTFITSIVTEILEQTDKHILFKTLNSTYKVIINP